MHPEPRIGGSAMESLTGRLLVATPSLKDPNFERMLTNALFWTARKDVPAK